MVGFVDEQAEGRDASNPPGQADNGFLSILNGFHPGATKSSQDVYRYTVDPADGAKSDIAANAPNNPLENALAAPPRPAGTIAYIGSGATVYAGEDIGVRAKADLKFDSHMGGLVGGAGGLGASIGVTTIDRNVEAYIGSSATVSAGSGDVLVHSEFTNTTGSTAWSGLAGAITLGAEVAVINDHSHVLAHVDNFANIAQAGDTLDVKAVADRSVQATTVNGAVSAIASIGAAVSVANLGGETRAYLGAVNIGAAGTFVIRREPLADGPNLLAGRHGRGVPDHRLEIPAARHLQPQHAEAGVGIVKRHALDRAADGGRVGLPRRDRGRSPPAVWPQRQPAAPGTLTHAALFSHRPCLAPGSARNTQIERDVDIVLERVETWM